ncbi:MAG TPA: DUF6054 family protein [Clostridia bacterium]|nr:DUF6054 family protein [Clostridia bacterium]
MAKSEFTLRGNFDEILGAIESGIMGGSISASLEDKTDITLGDVRCAVRVFERYSMMGSNRVSLSVTLLGQGEKVLLSAITAGGSQAMFFKINTFGERAFLECVDKIARGFNG